MKTRQKIIIVFIGLFIILSAIRISNAATVGISEVGVWEGDEIRWYGTALGNTGTVKIAIDSVNGTGNDLVVTGDLLGSDGSALYNQILLEWNAETEELSLGILNGSAILLQVVYIAPKLNLDAVVTFLEDYGSTCVLNGLEISAIKGDSNVVLKFDNDGILISANGDAPSYGGKISIKRVYDDDEISLGYTLFFVIPVAIILVIIRKRKTVKLA